MKLRLSALVEDARGKDGNLVVRKGRTGLIATPRVTPKNPRSIGQTKARGNLDRSSKAFANMTTAQAAQWNLFGASIVRHDPVSGKSYTSTGIAAWNELTTKFYQITPTGTAPLTPPTSAFSGDSLSVGFTGGSAQVTFAASAGNATGVRTEILLQQLKGRNRKPSAGGYVSRAFFPFAAGSLTFNLSVGAGYWAAAYRFVNVATGQATGLVALGTVVVS